VDSLRVGARRYEKELLDLQGLLNEATRARSFRQRSLVVVFEGWDAAGKGSSIRRITAALDARQYEVVPTAAPSDEELARPYLWRFWRRVPPLGRVALFDRSWYGRVLVERVEGLCAPADWARAYAEINLFEQQLLGHGAVIRKFWLHISPAEQLRRFRSREHVAFKRFKLTAEDWRNRKRWPDYERAVCDMVARTSTANAPWVLVEAEDKAYARLKILRTLVDALKSSDSRPRTPRRGCPSGGRQD